jgi:hypothetical protein
MEQGDSLTIKEEVKNTLEEVTVLEKKSPRMRMIVKSMVWERVSHGLFDYESHEITRSQFSFKSSGIIIRDENIVEFKDYEDSLSYSKEEESDPKVLAYARLISDNEYLIQPRDGNQPLNNRMWIIVRSIKVNGRNEGYAVQPNDIIKIGRVVLRVRELNTDNCLAKETLDEEFMEVTTLQDEPENEELCKFCWIGEETEDNPKMCPCSCTGSMRYIHFKCLQHWMDTRKQEKVENGVHSLTWKNFDCEI